MAHDAYQVNGPQIIFENIDGELVLINMRKGSYYSTDRIGAELWDMLVAGRPVVEMRGHIGARYEGDAAAISAGLDAFLEELQREDLIVAAECPQGNGRPHPEAPASRAKFQAPVLNKYRDMEDMLMLDPIHEVEEAGWPTARPAEVPGPASPKTGD